MTKPEAFKTYIQNLFSNKSTDVLRYHETSIQPVTFRIMSVDKKLVEESLTQEGFKFTKLLNIPNGYVVIKSPKELSYSTVFLNNQIYIQEASSMLPAIILDPKPGETILDLCAAPGSKTTQLVQLSDGKADIIANEENKNRYFKLKEILKNYNLENIQTINYDGVTLPYKRRDFINYFDKILVDAPCSNEANINFENEKTYANWNTKLHKKFSKLQKGLLNSAIRMLKPGGTLVYSTCTYSIEENEMVINWLLDKNNNIQLEEVSIDVPSKTLPFENNGKKPFNPEVSKTLRILPNEIYKGFFICSIKKL